MSAKGALKRNTIAQICIVTMVVILLLMVWPFRVFEHSHTSTYQKGIVTAETGAVTMDEIVLQPFVPADYHIADMEMAVRVDGVHEQDRVFVTIYNDAFDMIWQEVVYFSAIEAMGCISVSPQLDVVPEQIYYVGINTHFDSEGVLTAVYGNLEELKVPELESFTYAGTLTQGQAVLMEFRYSEPFSDGLRVLCTIGILVAGVAGYVAAVWVMHLINALSSEKKRILKKSLLIVGAAIYGLGLIFVFYQLCIARMFGGMALDIGVYAVSCLILGAGGALFVQRAWKQNDTVRISVSVKHKVRTEKVSAMREKLDKYTDVPMWQNYLQILSLVLLLYAGIMYVNSSVQWKQDLNGNWVLLLFGLAIVAFYRARDVFNIVTLVWGLFMIPMGMVYCYLHAGEDHGTQVGAVFMVAVFVWGVILAKTIRTWNDKKLRKVNLPVAVIWILMCIGMILAAHGKRWPLMMTVTFTLFFLQYDSDRRCRRVIRNFENAVLVNFGLILILCLLYRPYEYYQFYRYPMWFHTVASTGMYLILVETVAVVRLYMRMHKMRSIFCGCMKEWICYGVVTAYIVFTAARTTLMGVCGILAILLIAAIVTERLSWKQYIRVFGSMMLMVVLSVPVCYTATRCIPAVVNEPRYMVAELEDFKEAVKKGDAPDSYKYMNFKALMRLLGERFGLPEFMVRPFADDALAKPQQMDMQSLGDLASGSTDGSEIGLVQEEVQLLTSADQDDGQEQEVQTSKINEMSNGRIGIFKMYLKELNWTGHDSMVLRHEDGTQIAHSHNTFIQMAYDFGILTGILSLGLCLFVIMRAVILIWKGQDRSEAMYLSLMISAAYLITSISEYTGNPNMPLGFAYLFLLITMRMDKNVIK